MCLMSNITGLKDFFSKNISDSIGEYWNLRLQMFNSHSNMGLFPICSAVILLLTLFIFASIISSLVRLFYNHHFHVWLYHCNFLIIYKHSLLLFTFICHSQGCNLHHHHKYRSGKWRNIFSCFPSLVVPN